MDGMGMDSTPECWPAVQQKAEGAGHQKRGPPTMRSLDVLL